MQGFHQARANESRLRVVFRDDQVSFGFPAERDARRCCGLGCGRGQVSSRRRHSHRRHNARARKFIHRVKRSLPWNALTYRSLASPITLKPR